jgi:MFS transporter, NNP family, nitrate/nitrite transporter
MLDIKGNSQKGLFGATLGFFIGFAAVALFGVTANRFKDALQLSPTMVGLLVAIPSLSGSLLRIPFAAWVDTTGGRKPFLVLLSLSIAGMAGLTWIVYSLYPNGLTPDLFPVILTLGILSGCGIATFSVGISQVSYWFPKAKQGGALGTFGGIGNLAPGIFTFVLPFVIGGIGLAGAYLAWLIILIAGTVGYYFTGLNSPYFQLCQQGKSPEEAKSAARQAGQEIFPTGKVIDSLKRSAGVWRTWVLVVMYFTSFGGFLAITAWLPTYWKSYFSVGVIAAGALTALYSITTSLIRVAGGKIADKRGGENTALVALSVMLVGAVLMVLSHNLALSIGAVLVMALGMGVSNASIFKLVPQSVPQAVGGASGWVGGLGAFGGFVIPPLLGSIVVKAGAPGYASGFGLFIGMAFVAINLTLVLKSRQAGI